MKVGIRVGVTLPPSGDLDALLWSNGINQNAALLLLLLQRLQNVSDVVGIDGSGAGKAHPIARWAGVPTLPVEATAGAVDLIVELGARAAPDLMHRFQEAGGRLVSYLAGNALAMNFEAVASGVDHGEILSDVRFDAVWVTPQHWRMNEGYCRLTRSDHVCCVPHIWEPIFIEAYWRRLGISPFFKGQVRGGWRVGILEATVNVLKTFHLPLLSCEEAFRVDSGLLARVLIFNSSHLVGVPHFDEFTTNIDLYRAGRLFAEARMPTPQILGRFVDAVVAHQWENELNYLFWDVLWSGRPLIHNSDALDGIGYRYRSFDPDDGGRVLIDALSRHAAEAGVKRRQALEFLHQFSIDCSAVIQRHEWLLEEVMS